MSKKRLIIDRPYIGAIVMSFVLFLGIPVLATIPGAIVGSLTSIGDGLSRIIGAIIVSFVTLLIYRLWLRKEHFKGVLAFTGRGFGEVCGVALITFAVNVICIIVIAFTEYGGIANMVAPSVATILISLCAGTYEETAFRAIPNSILMKNRPTTKRIVLAVIITSVIFGGVHMANISAGANFGITVYQSFQAMIIGVFLAALYVRSGSIVLSMAFHFLHDMTSMMLPTQNTGVMLQQSVGIGTVIPDIIIMTCELVAAIYLLRPSKMDEIKESWADKWADGIC